MITKSILDYQKGHKNNRPSLSVDDVIADIKRYIEIELTRVSASLCDHDNPHATQNFDKNMHKESLIYTGHGT